MSFQVTWGRGRGGVTVRTSGELDAVLDSIEPDPEGNAYGVGIVAQDLPSTSTIPPLLDVCIGHAERSFVYFVGSDGTSAWGFEPDLPPMERVYADHGGSVDEAWPERVRVLPATARRAAREFVEAGAQRPTCLMWDTDG